MFVSNYLNCAIRSVCGVIIRLRAMSALVGAATPPAIFFAATLPFLVEFMITRCFRPRRRLCRTVFNLRPGAYCRLPRLLLLAKGRNSIIFDPKESYFMYARGWSWSRVQTKCASF